MRKVEPITGRQLGELARLLEERGVGRYDFQNKFIIGVDGLFGYLNIYQEKESDDIIKGKSDYLKQLFDVQIVIFKNRGVPEETIEALQNEKNVVVQNARGMTIGEGNIPFLPVIKPVYMGYYGYSRAMARVNNGGKTGYTLLKPAFACAFMDLLETPDNFYYIYDVEDGNATRGKSPEAAEKIFKQRSRSPLTAREVISLCILTDVLSRHGVWATGSRYESAGKVLEVSLDDDGRPMLHWDPVESSLDHRGSPSCGSR